MLTPPTSTLFPYTTLFRSSSLLGVHTPLEIVHRSVTLKPGFSPVTVLTFEVGAVMLAPFAAPTIVHSPELIVGALPADVKLTWLHCCYVDPAYAAVCV